MGEPEASGTACSPESLPGAAEDAGGLQLITAQRLLATMITNDTETEDRIDWPGFIRQVLRTTLTGQRMAFES
jgi:hypothetical protein